MSEEKLNQFIQERFCSEEFLKPMSLSQNHLALDIGVHARRINEYWHEAQCYCRCSPPPGAISGRRPSSGLDFRMITI